MKYVIPQIPNVASHDVLKYFMKEYSYIYIFLFNNNIMLAVTSIEQLSEENIVAKVSFFVQYTKTH